MKPFSTLLTATLLLASALPADAAGCGKLAREFSRAAVRMGKKRVAVIPFQGVAGRNSLAGRVVSERLIAALLDLGAPEVVERHLLDAVLREQRLGTYGMVDPRTVQELGKVLGVDALVTGTTLELKGGDVEVHARLIDARTARVLSASTVRIEKEWSDFPSDGFAQWTVAVPPVPGGGYLAGVNDWHDGLNSGEASPCDKAKRRARELEEPLVDLKARFWALRLRDPSFSSSNLTRNPGSEIEDPEIRGRFYSRLRMWHEERAILPLSPEEHRRLSESEGRLAALAEVCAE